MKKSNVLGIIGAVLAVAIVVSLISWMVVRKSPAVLQGEADVTSYKASSKIAGRIEKMAVTEGQTVKKGDLLYVLSTPELDAKLRQATAAQNAAGAQERKAMTGARTQEIEAARSMMEKAEAGLDLAQKSYDRVKNLYEQGVLPAQKFDEASANLRSMEATADAARAQYNMARDGARTEDKSAAEALLDQASGAVAEVEAYLADAFVYSPVDGEISTVIAREGEVVGSGYPVVTILDASDIWVSYNVKETLMPRIKKGVRFTAYVPALDRNMEFEVDHISSQADFATWSATRTQGGFDVRTFNVRTRPVGDAGGLRPGMSALMNWDDIK